MFNSIQQFANIYSEKMGVDAELLLKSLWGDFYFNAKAKKIVEGAQATQYTQTHTHTREQIASVHTFNKPSFKLTCTNQHYTSKYKHFLVITIMLYLVNHII